MFYRIVKVTSNESRHVINIPASMARETGIDKAEYVIITKSANNKLEVKRYDNEGDITEYIQKYIDKLNKSTKKGKGKKK